MPYGPEDARRFNPLIKLDRHALMWTDMVNNAINRGRPEQKAIDEANSAINMDITRSRVMSEPPGKPQPLQGYDPGFDIRPPLPSASGSKQERMQPLPEPYTAAPGDRENTIPAGAAGRRPPLGEGMKDTGTRAPPPVPTPVETISERFPGSVPPPDLATAIKRYESEDRTKPKGKPIRPGTEERFLDPTKRTI